MTDIFFLEIDRVFTYALIRSDQNFLAHFYYTSSLTSLKNCGYFFERIQEIILFMCSNNCIVYQQI